MLYVVGAITRKGRGSIGELDRGAGISGHLAMALGVFVKMLRMSAFATHLQPNSMSGAVTGRY